MMANLYFCTAQHPVIINTTLQVLAFQEIITIEAAVNASEYQLNRWMGLCLNKLWQLARSLTSDNWTAAFHYCSWYQTHTCLWLAQATVHHTVHLDHPPTQRGLFRGLHTFYIFSQQCRTQSWFLLYRKSLCCLSAVVLEVLKWHIWIESILSQLQDNMMATSWIADSWDISCASRQAMLWVTRFDKLHFCFLKVATPGISRLLNPIKPICYLVSKFVRTR